MYAACLKIGELVYKCFLTSAVVMKNYQSSLLILHIRLVCVFRTQKIIRVHSLQTLATHDNIDEYEGTIRRRRQELVIWLERYRDRLR